MKCKTKRKKKYIVDFSKTAYTTTDVFGSTSISSAEMFSKLWDFVLNKKLLKVVK